MLFGCGKKQEVCCLFENGCSIQKSDADCTKAGGTPSKGKCKQTVDVENDTVTYECEE
jgi:hypothetical protein